MAKQVIDRETIAKKDYLDNVLDPLKALKVLLGEIDTALKSLAKDTKSALAFKTDAKGMREQEALQKKINAAYQQKVKLDKESIRIEKEQVEAYEKFTKEVKKREAAEAKAFAKREAQYNKEIKQAAELDRPYVKLSTTLNNLRKEYRDLAVSGQEFTKRGRELKTQITSIDSTLKKVDADMGVFGRNVGNYTGAIQKGFKSAMNVVQQFGLALGGIALARSAITTIVEFDSAIADLSAITGLAGKDLDFFKENAIRLGVNVKGGAKEVVEAYKLIASAKPELLDNAAALNKVTEAAILLSRASGMELPDAATALTDAMNQFGAGADQAGKFVDILAAGAKFGSAEIPQITEALLRFGAVAKTSNVSIQESTALIEALAEKGLKGADAGTALRNVMLKLGAPDALGKDARARLKALGINFGDLTDKSKSFAQRLDALKPLLKDNGALVKVFGTENAVAATTLLSTTDRVKELTAAVDENGVAQEQADARSKTLDAAYNRLKETFNGMVLEFANGANAAEGLVNFLDFVRENLPIIVKSVYELTKAFVIFKGVMKAMQLKDSYQAFKKLGEGIKSTTEDLSKSAEKGKAFGAALKGIGWTIAIDLAFKLGYEIYRIATGAAQAEENINRMKAAMAMGSGIGSAAATRELDEQNKQFAELDRKAKIRIADGEDEKKVNADIMAQKALIIGQTNEQLKQSIRSANNRKSDYKDLLKETEDIQKAFNKRGYNTQKEYNRLLQIQKEIKLKGDDVYLGLIENQGDATDIAAQLRANIGGVNEQLTELNGALDQNTEAFKDQNTEIYASAAAYTKAGEKIEDYTQKVRELRDAQIKDAQSRDETQLKTKLDADLAAIKDNGIQANELRIELERTYQADLLKLQKHYALLRIEAEYEYWDAIRASQQQAKAEYESEQDEAFNQEIKAVTDQDKKLELQALKSGKDGEISDEALEKRKLKRKKESLRQQIEIARFYGKETLDLELELANLEREGEKKKVEEQKKTAEDLAKFRNNLIQQGTKYLSDQIDKQIALLEKRKQKSAELEDFLKQGAINGNITAQESIVAQQRIQEEADRKKIELERRKANIIAVGSVLQTYNNKTAAGDKFPLASTIIESGALFEFLSNIPKFYSGIDDTGKGGDVDNKGGFTAVLHPNEQVWSKDDRKDVGYRSRQEIKDAVKIADQFNTGNMVHREAFQGATAGNSFDIAALLKKQDNIVSAIESLPSKDIDVEKLAEGIIQLTATKSTHNFTRQSKWLIRK